MTSDVENRVVPPLLESERPGKMLRGLRLRAGMTQAQLASALGVPQSRISAYENNIRPIPTEKARQLAKVLHSVSENFISVVLWEKFDYTQWQREYFDNVTPEEFDAAALEWARSHPGIKGSYTPADKEIS
ncbi:MAG: helix-turn-helix transcriptional regulator [Desulfovibrio sp.]|nr:helix-turn-helix transcriptional regulator [Desulfovibrio sp.]